MAQKITGYVKLQIPAGKATPAPPVGPALGQHGVNIMAQKVVGLIKLQDSYDNDADSVTMMTIHSAKGLEFPYVFVVGMEDGIFPGEMAKYNEEDMEEDQ